MAENCTARMIDFQPMPELPDIELYLSSLRARVAGRELRRVVLGSPFLLRSVEPPLESAFGVRVTGLSRLGKRIVFELSNGVRLVLHLMIAGRLWWVEGDGKFARVAPASFLFENGSLHLTEAGTKRRAALHVVEGEAGIRAMDRGGVEPLTCSFDEFAGALRRENHTLKRSLTDPTLFAGIGNAYSDEILHRARLSPVLLTKKISDDDARALYDAVRAVLTDWTRRLREEFGDRWPDKVTAFRPGMAVHGRFKEPCPVCGTAVQRIVHAENESNYCARCQTGGKLLADRALSQLLKKDWPRTIEEWEDRRRDVGQKRQIRHAT